MIVRQLRVLVCERRAAVKRAQGEVGAGPPAEGEICQTKPICGVSGLEMGIGGQNKANLPGWGREIRNPKLETRNKPEIRRLQSNETRQTKRAPS